MAPLGRLYPTDWQDVNLRLSPPWARPRNLRSASGIRAPYEGSQITCSAAQTEIRWEIIYLDGAADRAGRRCE